MLTRKFTLALAVLFGWLLVASTALAQDVVTGHADLHPVHQSGVFGDIDFTQTDSSVRVTGTATGLEPSAGRYVSLVYDRGSVPGGPVACEPTTDEPGPVGMFIGSWVVDDTGNGTLVQENPFVATLEQVDTVSIRDTQINNGFGPEAVVACGEIAVRGGR